MGLAVCDTRLFPGWERDQHLVSFHQTPDRLSAEPKALGRCEDRTRADRCRGTMRVWLGVLETQSLEHWGCPCRGEGIDVGETGEGTGTQTEAFRPGHAKPEKSADPPAVTQVGVRAETGSGIPDWLRVPVRV